uniref:Down syndrome cell adhesion molecule-like protein Dscam2 n=1 Tax=Steinernema glaseri TaxID=37863 RepID=A0A1I7ZAG1_9BILA
MVFGAVLSLTTTLSLSCFYNASLCINGTDLPGQGTVINPPPIIQHGHSNQTLMLGSTAILPCQATGRIAPHISWLRNGRPLNFEFYGNRYQQLSTGSLQISDLQKSDTDVYTCRAKNADGEATWTASLTVEGHSDPSTVFSRMSDTSAFPSAPGRPMVLNYTDDSVELEWSAPERQGVNPVSGYILQYYSPEMGETWNNVQDYISGTRFRVKHLKPGNTYVFVIRAENSKGIGPPSLVSPAVRTKMTSFNFDSDHYATTDLDTVRQRLGSQQLIRLEEVKIINSTAVRIIWKLRRNEPLIEGYSVRWRGPPLSNDAQWVNVTDGLADSVVINGFKPFTHYEFFVIPYHKTVSGMPSNTLSGYTDEAPPSAPPSDVRIRMMNLTTLRISWRPPPADGINGILKGFEIIILGDGVKFNRNITTNERAASVTLFHLITGMTYRVRVAAKTGAGTGVYHGTDSVTMDEATLKKHLQANDGRAGQFWYYLTQPWVIALIAIFLWVILVALIVLVFLRYKKHKAVGKETPRGHNPFIRINDGSVHSGPRDTFWMDPVSYNNMNQNTLMREQCIPQLYTKTPNQNDFMINGKVHMGSHGQLLDYATATTMDRAPSPHHYHYAALPEAHAANNMSTFYGRQFHDDPSPYATTTLVMNNHQSQKWLTDHMLRGPVLPSKPIPPGPPGSFSNDHHTGCHTISAATRRAMHNHAPSHHSHSDLTNGRMKNQVPGPSDSPPHTDVSYVQFQSSDGTGGSSGRGKEANSWDRRSPPKPNLMDMIPPPPPGAPPNVDSDIYAIDGAAETGDHYDSVSESLLYAPNNSSGSHHRLGSGLVDETARHSTAKNSRPTSRSRAGPRDTRLAGDDNDSQRSSLMMDDEDRAADLDSEFENDVSDTENSHPVKKSKPGPYSPNDQSPMSRPAQPCMGVRSSTLAQSTYDPVASKRSTTRLKSLPRNSRKDMV